MRRSVALWTSSVVLVAAAVLVGSAQVAQAGDFSRADGPDFDCDGIRDGVLAMPWAFVNDVDSAGSMTVTYGGSGASQEINQATPGVPGTPEFPDSFGQSYTWYDRNSDGCDDLVVAAPNEAIGSRETAGTVTVILGSPAGLDPARSTEYTQDTSGYPDAVEEGDVFGSSLAAGRTHQGVPFLLIGSSGETGPNGHDPDIWKPESGAVYYVRPGSISVVHQDSPGVASSREYSDFFGASLAASDRFFVVGSPGETVGSELQAGMVHVFSHTLTGGRPTPVGSFHQNTTGISSTAEELDSFGVSLSVVSYRPAIGDPIGALVGVGAPGETVGDAEAGMAHLVSLSPRGAVRERVALTQNTAGVTGTAEHGDNFGIDVVLANLHPTSSVATPQTLAWAVAAEFEVSVNGAVGGVHVFRPGWRTGNPDIWLRRGLLGIEVMDPVLRLRSSHTLLSYAGPGGPCVSLGWPELLAGGELQPEVRPFDDCG